MASYRKDDNLSLYLDTLLTKCGSTLEMQHHHNCSTKCENKDSNKTGKDQLQFTEIYSNKSQSDQLSSSSSSDVNSGRSQLETILLSDNAYDSYEKEKKESQEYVSTLKQTNNSKTFPLYSNFSNILINTKETSEDYLSLQENFADSASISRSSHADRLNKRKQQIVSDWRQKATSEQHSLWNKANRISSGEEFHKKREDCSYDEKCIESVDQKKNKIVVQEEVNVIGMYNRIKRGLRRNDLILRDILMVCEKTMLF